MERSPQRRIRPVVRCRVDWPLSLPTRHYHYRANRRRPLWCWVWLTGLDLSASAEVTAHVLLEDFDVLKPRNTEGERSPETHFHIGAFDKPTIRAPD
jgi:hypothetical protein